MDDVDWSERETITAFLTYRRRRSGPHWLSSLIAALRDARGVTGRYLTTGNVNWRRQGHAATFLGALGYMVLLDQIGECFRPAGTPVAHTTDFLKALIYFAPEVPDSERDALYALRCSFAHDYSLVNVPPAGHRNREGLTHHFLLDDDAQGPVVKLPVRTWDGDLERRSLYTATRISLTRFGDLAESIYQQLCALHNENRLIVALPGGATELRQRYAFSVYPGRSIED